VEADAAVLRHLEAQSFPAERLAAAEPVSTFDARGVLVTEFVDGPTIGHDPRTLERIGDLLGRLHSLPAPTGAAARAAGSWHHISHAGGPRSADADVLRPLLQAAKDPNRTPVHLMKHIDALQAELDAIDDGAELPQALIHIDLGGPNVIETPDGELVGIDWAGSGVGARIASLAALMATGGDRERVEAFVRGYRSHVQLEGPELDRLGTAIRSHSLVLDAWTIVFAPAYAQHVVDSLDAKRSQCDTIAALVRDAYSAPHA
jgi:Ser/Thr protein kinase RdoA (MazF antagonist)